MCVCVYFVICFEDVAQASHCMTGLSMWFSVPVVEDKAVV